MIRKRKEPLTVANAERPVKRRTKDFQPSSQASSDKKLAAKVLSEILGEPTDTAQVPESDSKSKVKVRKGKAAKNQAGSHQGDASQQDAPAKLHTPKQKASKSLVGTIKKQEKEPEHVDGIFEGEELYLRDSATGRVFSSTRDKRGRLVLVGTWDSQGKCIDFTVPEEAEVETTDLDPGSVVAADAAPSAVEESKPGRIRPRIEDQYPFEIDPDDHCETDALAYADIQPFLSQICRLLGKTKHSLRIYDPYYCAGSVIRHLGALGYKNVYNKNEDFYAMIEQGKVPEYDVLVTNPPYSESHIEQLLRFCVTQQQPWLLLVPNYVCTKPFYQQILASNTAAPSKPFYVVPKKRYYYWTPKGVARNNAKVRKDGRTSPFITFWYLDCQKMNPAILRWWQEKGYKHSHVKAIKDIKNLPESVTDAGTSTRRHMRK